MKWVDFRDVTHIRNCIFRLKQDSSCSFVLYHYFCVCQRFCCVGLIKSWLLRMQSSSSFCHAPDWRLISCTREKSTKYRRKSFFDGFLVFLSIRECDLVLFRRYRVQWSLLVFMNRFKAMNLVSTVERSSSFEAKHRGTPSVSADGHSCPRCLLSHVVIQL